MIVKRAQKIRDVKLILSSLTGGSEANVPCSVWSPVFSVSLSVPLTESYSISSIFSAEAVTLLLENDNFFK